LNNKGVESYENNPDRMSAGLLQHLLFGSADRRQWQVGEIKRQQWKSGNPGIYLYTQSKWWIYRLARFRSISWPYEGKI